MIEAWITNRRHLDLCKNNIGFYAWHFLTRETDDALKDDSIIHMKNKVLILRIV